MDDAGRLPRNVRERIVRRAEEWAGTGHGDLAPLHNIPGATHRLRVGDWRAFLVLDLDKHSAEARRVFPRGSDYTTRASR